MQHSPWHWSRGRTFHLVEMTLSRTCRPKSVDVLALCVLNGRGGGEWRVVQTDVHLVCGYCASDRILSTMSHASGSSLNCATR